MLGWGLLTRLREWLPLSRRGGHGTEALFSFALVFLAAGRRWGIRPFSIAYALPLQRLIAPLVGLKALPTAASMSRALGRLKEEEVRAFSDRLLIADPGTSALLASQHVLHRDALGAPWHVLDFDPTIEAFRQRDLPADASMPEPTRIAPGTPGYTGHKRGELRIRHLPLLHAGSGLWLAYRLDATGGSLLPLLANLLRVARSTLDKAAPHSIVVRADGEFGSVGAMRTCLAGGVHVLTRLSRYSLLDRAEIKAELAAARWRKVASDGSGPPREAADLGVFMLYPTADAHDADGGPVSVRVVVTRFRRSSKPEHGVLRDGHQLEMLATNLPADAWPAEHLVTHYFGRGAMENRFAQEDREIGIDRTFSNHPPGQEWMSGIGLFLWNMLVVRGVAAAPLGTTLPDQERRPHSADDDAQHPSVLPPVHVDLSDATQVDASDEPGPVAPPAAPCAESLRTTEGDEGELRQELWSIARKALDNHSLPAGWSLDDERRVLRCQNGEELSVYAVQSEARKRDAEGERTKHRIMLRTDTRACYGCPFGPECTSAKTSLYRQVTRAISGAEAARGRGLLDTLKKYQRKEQLLKRHRRPQAPTPAAAETPAPRRPLRVESVALPPGNLVPASPLFLPAASRGLVRELVRAVNVGVALAPGPTPHRPPAHPLLATSQEARRHQRATWAQRAVRHKYIGKASLSLGRLRSLLRATQMQIGKLLAL
jgi:hypothetical protein